MKIFLGMAAAAVVLAGALPARAMEHVTLKNGFEYDCVRREAIGDKVRLFFGQGGANYLDIAADAVMRVEMMPDPVPGNHGPGSARGRNSHRCGTYGRRADADARSGRVPRITSTRTCC